MSWSTHLNSALVVLIGSGRDLSFAYFSSNSLPLWMSMVASPPSSTIWSAPSAPGHVSICSVHHQYSDRVSPFHAKTAEVLKMLQEHHRTLAPKAARVSIRT